MGVTRRAYSRVVEFDPTTLKIVWEYSHKQLGGTRKRNPVLQLLHFLGPAPAQRQYLDYRRRLFARV